MRFRFVGADWEPGPGAVTRLGAWIRTPGELFQAYFYSLELPGYFGFNWDALADVMTDLSWAAPGPRTLFHLQLPALTPEDLTIYLEILAETDDPRLEVVFRERDQSRIESLLAGSNR